MICEICGSDDGAKRVKVPETPAIEACLCEYHRAKSNAEREAGGLDALIEA